MEEVWKTIDGFNGIYEVSSHGRVRSYHKAVPKMLSGWQNEKGYLCVSLVGDKLYKRKIHKLVAMVFLSHTPCGMEITVDHKDGNKLNNRLDNLQLLSNSDNVRKYHSGKTGFSYPRKCSINGCENKHDAKGFCKKHWNQNRNLQPPIASLPDSITISKS